MSLFQPGLSRISEDTPHVHDFIGIGFGPSNLSVAIAADEKAQVSGQYLEDVYLEMREDFQWHPGMLLESSRLQVTFLKDLISMENPRSRYTFINYLFEHDRLHEFINLRTFYPTRLEFNDYYRWVAKHFEHKVRFRRKVTEILPVDNETGSIELLKVIAQNQSTNTEEVLFTRNLTLALGGQPWVPSSATVRPGGRAFHSSLCRDRLEDKYSDRNAPYRFILVGGGQTSADILYHLINQYPNAQITVAMKEFAFKPQDDTQFVNELFFPEFTDMFFNMPEEKREKLWNRHTDVTHRSVDIDLIPLLYDAMYQDRVQGRNRIQIKRFVDLKSSIESEDSVIATFHDLLNEGEIQIEGDALIMATGYRQKLPDGLLDNIGQYLLTNTKGRYEVERSYAVKTSDNFLPKIYLQGYCEPTHGFSEVVLSLLPVRSASIIDDMVDTLPLTTSGTSVLAEQVPSA